MRILSLNLERFGPFTGRTLTFKSDARLHVVYGENEAGKSCALAAITDLFFGIKRPTHYDFLHEGRELRIGAIIATRDGNKLAFKRRYGNKNTLIDLADKVLSDDTLLPYLGNLSRGVFCNAFGLDAETLRLGAEEMLKSDGEVGESLFAAASGMRGLSDLRRSIEEQADGIFAPRASKDRSFYQALGRFEDARKAIREKELRAGDWKALNDKIDELARRLEQIKVMRGTKAAECARLSRIKRIAPLVRLIDDELRKLKELGPLPELASEFADQLRKCIDANQNASEASKRAAADQVKAARTHADITVDEALIARAGNVLRLFGETSAYANDSGDLPRIQAEMDVFNGELAGFAVRLGLANAAAVEAGQPTAAAQALIRSLTGEGRRIADERKRHTGALAEERESIAELEDLRAKHGDFADPQPFREKFAAFTPVLKASEGRTKLDQEIRSEVRNVREAGNRLAPSIADLDKLAAAALPNLETVTRFRKEFDDLAQEVRREQDRLTSAIEALAASEAKLEELVSGRPVPSRESIAAKRKQRDAEWQHLRATLFGSPNAITGAALAEGVTNFEHYSSEADELADTAISDAKRVASHAAENKRAAEERAKEAKARERLASLDAKQQKMSTAWNAVWSAVEITPLPPVEMTTWLTAVNALLGRREKLNSLNEELATIDAAASGIMPMINALAAEIGLSELKGLDLAPLATRVQDRLRIVSDAWDKVCLLDTRIRDVQRRIERLTTAESDDKRLLNDWSMRWKIALPAIGLMPTATLEEAEAALNAWSAVPSTIRERDNRARRVAGMQRNIKDFEDRTKPLLDQLAPDLVKLPAETAVKEMNDRLTAARAAETRKVECERSLTEAVREGAAADKALKDVEATLTALAAKLPRDTDLTDLLVRDAQRADLLKSLNDRRAQLIIQADGHTEDELRANLQDFNSDDAEATLKILGEEDDALEREAQEVFAANDRSLRERESLELGVGAEIAVQQRRSAEAELTAAAREWLVFKLAALLIGTAIDRRRASQQDPLLARAGALFATLTGGSFAGVGQDFDDQDIPRLVGRRPLGATVPVTGMSTGARDQLYLALRLAYLESYADRAEPAPFIGDDLFASFDEDRTAHGLAALAAIGDRVQPILFTHHRHVAEIARNKIGADVSVLNIG